ncbi:death-associated protein 1-like [Diadema setosum]|uniref:death-associated protein 1-like n=1 Tax=Diadema setosum TaxID=31175 RepID=UPI003B3B82A9
MSSPGKSELKAGHPPAVKVGGVRIPGKVQTEKVSNKEPDVGDEEIVETVVSPHKSDTKVLISGAPSQGNKDFPPEAIKHYHEKVMPTNQKSASNRPTNILQQPRKN